MTSPRRRARETALKALYQAEISETENNDALCQVLAETIYRPAIEVAAKGFLKSSKAEEILSGNIEDFVPDVTDSLSAYPQIKTADIAEVIRESIERNFPDALLNQSVIESLKTMTDQVKQRIEKVSGIEEFACELVSKVTDNLATINKTIEETAKNWSLDRMANIDRCILRLSVCELFYFPTIPVNVTINEAIELAKKYSDERSYEFVNGILDKVSKAHTLNKETVVKSAAVKKQ